MVLSATKIRTIWRNDLIPYQVACQSPGGEKQYGWLTGLGNPAGTQAYPKASRSQVAGDDKAETREGFVFNVPVSRFVQTSGMICPFETIFILPCLLLSNSQLFVKP